MKAESKADVLDYRLTMWVDGWEHSFYLYLCSLLCWDLDFVILRREKHNALV